MKLKEMPKKKVDVFDQANQAILAMREAARLEDEFDPTGLPQVLVDKMKKSFAEQYVTAVIQAGRLVPDLLDEIKRLRMEKYVELTEKELNIAQLACTSALPYPELAKSLDMTLQTFQWSIRQVYRKYNVHNRDALRHAMRVDGSLTVG